MVTHGPALTRHSEFKEYQCPKDEGLLPQADHQGVLGAYSESMFLAVGTSYVGDSLVRDPVWDETGVSELIKIEYIPSVGKGDGIELILDRGIGRVGTFLRPANMIPDAAQTLLFYEGRLQQAIYLSQPFMALYGDQVAARSGIFEPRDVPAWHGRGHEFGAVMADGHAQRVRLRARGDIYDQTSFPLDEYGSRRHVMLRGADWRYDAVPAAAIREAFIDELP